MLPIMFPCLFVCYRLLSVEHFSKGERLSLYLVFEYVDTDLRRFIDLSWPGLNNPLPPLTIKVSKQPLPPHVPLE